jgi:adenylate cyclase
MLEKVEEIKPALMEEGYPEINIGVGLNTGDMNVGNMGSEFRRAYTVLGDNVNLGSRLEGLTKQYGVKLIVGETTRKGQDDFLFRNLDRVRVKGKDEPVEIYEPVCRTKDATDEIREELDQYHKALELYRTQHWQEAREIFTALKEANPDRLIYDIYLNERMTAANEAMLTDEWDGVFTHTSK